MVGTTLLVAACRLGTRDELVPIPPPSALRYLAHFIRELFGSGTHCRGVTTTVVVCVCVGGSEKHHGTNSKNKTRVIALIGPSSLLVVYLQYNRLHVGREAYKYKYFAI